MKRAKQMDRRSGEEMMPCLRNYGSSSLVNSLCTDDLKKAVPCIRIPWGESYRAYKIKPWLRHNRGNAAVPREGFGPHGWLHLRIAGTRGHGLTTFRNTFLTTDELFALKRIVRPLQKLGQLSNTPSFLMQPDCYPQGLDERP